MRSTGAASITALAGILLLSACQGEKEAPEAEPSASAAAAEPTPSAEPTRVAGGARDVEEDTPNYEFQYSYPWEVGTIAALKDKLDADIDKQRGELAATAKEDAEARKKDDIPFQKHSRSIGWKVVTDLPGWLSLSTIVSTYEGGAHPNYWFDALLWDRSAGVERKALDLFTSKEALSAAIRSDFCAAIDRQRAKKRGAPVTRGGDDPFSECLDPVAYTVILGSSTRKAFDRIGILVPPYEAGPYAEGDYEVTLPVSAGVLAAVKPEYRPVFVAGR